MPDQPPSKRRPSSPPSSRKKRTPTCANAVRYAELHCRTNYSFLEGASHPDELVQRASELGHEALVISDRNSLAGAVRAHAAAKAAGLKLLIGAEATPSDAPPVVLIATDRAAYGRLCRLLTVGRRRAPKGDCHLTLDDVAAHSQGLLACVPLSGVLSGILPGGKSLDRLRRYRDVFGDGCYALAELHRGADDRRRLWRMVQAAKQCDVPLAAAGDVYYHIPARQVLHDVVTAIRHGCTVAELGSRRFANAERHLKSPAQMAALFQDAPETVPRTAEVAARCTFSLDELRYEYPDELCPAGITALRHLRELTWAGARRRYPRGIPKKVRKLIEHELQLIEELRYEAYFLTVWDLVRFAKRRGILCQGRGSAANSVVCYCLEVTSVDPERIDVLFERFVSKERDEAPDIDIDFEHERREEVLQYIYNKYGRDRAGIAATVITYRLRSAIRDVGKALGLSLDLVDRIAKTMERSTEKEKLNARVREAGLSPDSTAGQQLLVLVREILGFPRHLSQHVGGMVLTRGPLCELVPIENAAMAERTVIQWDKDDLDVLGLLKVDCLSLGMLTAIRKAFAFVESHYDRPLTLATVPAEDPEVYTMISRADTMGVFQIESRAQMSMLPRLRPTCYYDLVIEVAIVRPGPIQGDMVHPYLRRRSGEEAVVFPDERIQAVLERTLGVPIFQEQAMRLAVVAAGFSPGEADQLRRAMGAWRRRGVIDKFRKKLLDGMEANGYGGEFAERLFKQIRGFGEYGFPESHAASFALLVYVSAWIKRYYPAVFTAALLNSQPMGFYGASQLVADARKQGVGVRPVDVNASDWDCTLELVDSKDHGAAPPHADSPPGPFALRLGFRMVRGLSSAAGALIVKERGDAPFASFEEFSHRTRLSSAILKKLSKADAFESLHLNRRSALWKSLPEQHMLPLFDDLQVDEPVAALPALSRWEEVVSDYRSIGLSLRGHPIEFIRPVLNDMQIVAATELAKLPANRRYKVAGLVLLRQRPSTAKGITFVTLEDETATANLIIRQDVWNRFHAAAAGASVLVAHGRLQRLGEVIHLLVDKLEDLSEQLANVNVRSRDFR